VAFLQLLLAGSVLLVCASCCEDKTESAETSPSGRTVAMVRYQNCGVLSAGTSVVLRPAKRRFWSKDALVLGADGRHMVTVLWKDEHTLDVYLPNSLRERDFADRKIAHKNEDVSGVHIEFHQL
jgi:hypothetical protein